MTQEKLVNLLTFVIQVKSHRWNMVMKLVEAINNNQAEVLKKEWYDKFKNLYPEYNPLDLNILGTWSTFDNRDCIDITFYIQDNELFCDAIIYDGDSFGGARTNKRFTTTLKINKSFITQLEGLITSNLDDIADNEYNVYLQTLKHEWVKNFKQSIINN